jgi:hypothetical protein
MRDVSFSLAAIARLLGRPVRANASQRHPRGIPAYREPGICPDDDRRQTKHDPVRSFRSAAPG